MDLHAMLNSTHSPQNQCDTSQRQAYPSYTPPDYAGIYRPQAQILAPVPPQQQDITCSLYTSSDCIGTQLPQAQYLLQFSACNSHYSLASANSAAQSSQTAPRQRASIACNYCRKRKIRCQGGAAPNSKCQNCSRRNQECLFQPVSSTSLSLHSPRESLRTLSSSARTANLYRSSNSSQTKGATNTVFEDADAGNSGIDRWLKLVEANSDSIYESNLCMNGTF